MALDTITDIEIGLDELTRLVEERTHRRIQGLRVEKKKNGTVVLLGRARSYHLKQVAQHGILDVMPDVHLINSIEVH